MRPAPAEPRALVMLPDFVTRSYRQAELMEHRTVVDAFGAEEVARILELARSTESSPGAIADSQVFEEVRKSKVSWIGRSDESGWIFDRIGDLVVEANEELWGFDLGGMKEALQYSIYEAPAGGYDWHLDLGNASSAPALAWRKISVVVQLSDPDECFGGELELRPARHVVVPELSIGGAVLFPSYLLHRVRPVKQGQRESLVSWITGPPFR